MISARRGRRGSLTAMALLLAAFVLGAASTAAHATGSGPYYVASLNSTIDPGAADFITTSLNNARAVGADHFVLVLNTFGGDGGSMDAIVQAISSFESSGGTFITLIAPSGSHAFSAGAYISEASDEIYMVSGTTIGSATPIVSGIPTGEVNTTMAKDIGGFSAYMMSLTSDHGRNETATGLMVTKGVSYTAQEAYRLHVVDGLLNSTSLEGALSSLGVPPGTQVQTPGVRSTLLSILSDPNLSGLLFLVGVFAIMIDMYHPTMVLTVIGAAAVVLALVGLGVFGAPLTAVLLMFIGAVFIFLEVKTHHGVSALVGVIVFAVGFLLVFQTPPPPPSLPPGTPPPGNFFGPGLVTYSILAVIGGGIVIASVYLYRIREDLRGRSTRFDLRRLVGKEGYLTSDLKAGGTATANIESEDWSVTGARDIPKGARVKVKETAGFKLIVERSEE